MTDQLMQLFFDTKKTIKMNFHLKSIRARNFLTLFFLGTFFFSVNKINAQIAQRGTSTSVNVKMYWDSYSGPSESSAGGTNNYFASTADIKVVHLHDPQNSGAASKTWELASTGTHTVSGTVYSGNVSISNYTFDLTNLGSSANKIGSTTASDLSTAMNNTIVSGNEMGGTLAAGDFTETSFTFTSSANNTSGSGSVMPVELINFTARATPEKKVALSWATATESVNKGFRIERQTIDMGSKFENIGFVNTKPTGGNSQSTLYYNFLDNNPKSASANHYRLVQEDLDGTLTYSEIRMVRLGNQSVSMIFPNPSSGNVTISRTDDGKKMNIQIIDLSGKVVKEMNNISEAYYKFNITQPGVYSIKMTYPETGEQSVQRVVVQR
jgi:hypothetical protein